MGHTAALLGAAAGGLQATSDSPFRWSTWLLSSPRSVKHTPLAGRPTPTSPRAAARTVRLACRLRRVAAEGVHALRERLRAGGALPARIQGFVPRRLPARPPLSAAVGGTAAGAGAGPRIRV